MRTVMNVIKMDMAVCKKSMIILILSMLLSGCICLFYFTPLLLGLFVVGSTAVVSAIFSVEIRSNMEFFYGCLPVRKWEYIVGRSLTCFLVMLIPSVICMVFQQLEIHFSLCKMEEVRLFTEMIDQYQMLAICAMIMLGFVGGANLLLVSFIGKIESREMLEVILLLLEALVAGAVLFIVQKTVFHDDRQELMNALSKMATRHEQLSCVLLVGIGLLMLILCTVISIKIVEKKRK